MKKKFLKYFIVLLLFTISAQAYAQKWAIKTNLLYDATATVNLGIETSLSKKWTFDLSGNFNAWTFKDNMKWKHWLVQPEFRFWTCEKFNGHFFGAHLLGGIYNIGNVNANFQMLGTDFSLLKDYRYEGWMAGAGIAYGYQWLLSKHWSMEAELGVGYIYSRYSQFECAHCGEKLLSNKPHHYFGPTKIALSLIYAF